MVSVLVADDELLAREGIAYLLQSRDDIEHLWLAADGIEALELANKHQPDIIFLDIQMPGLTGIQLAAQLPETSAIVFATAYNQYAINAFDLNAIDYLLKPFDDDRFFAAFDKAKSKIGRDKLFNKGDLQQLLQQIATDKDQEYKSRLVVKDPGRIRLVDIEQVLYIAGAGNYAEIHLDNQKMVLHRATLTSLESQLDPNVFVRIHRSTIVRKSSVVELRTNENGDYTVILGSGDKLTMSRRNKAKLGDILGFD